ncbi:RidA family protein [Lentzea sp. NPDC058436]|uniref:RidA family protein n=1 Tax=Lentzea sp. NPDC058436 TaxID=3346499 RepID=UPI00366076BD
MAQDAVTPPPASSFRRHGDLLLLSGQVGVDENWRPVEGTFQDEARAVFRNVRQVLTEAGSRPERILKVTGYLTDAALFPAYNEVWLEAFPDPEHRPARTTIVTGLHPPFRVELDVTAVADEIA